MKAMYRIVIKKVSTNETKFREMFLTPEQAEALRKKLGKAENGYILSHFYEQY